MGKNYTEEKEYLKPYDAVLAEKLAVLLSQRDITPNQVSVVRLVLAVIAMLAFVMGQYIFSIFGAGLFVFAIFLDHVDGELARMTKQESTFGHRLDLAADFVTHLGLFLGVSVGLMFAYERTSFAVLGLFLGVLVAVIFYLRMRIEETAGKQGSRQPNWNRFEVEDLLYLVPLMFFIKLGVLLFFLFSCIGLPLFTAFCVYQYKMIHPR